MRFCDSGTLDLVRKVWLSYVPDGPEPAHRVKHRSIVEERFKRAPQDRDRVVCTIRDSPLHYGTNVFGTFHLLTAYAELVGSSPSVEKKRNAYQRLMGTAKSQFHSWCTAFRRTVDNLTIRFCTAEVLAFCQTLQHLNITNERSANWPRTPYRVDTLTLDGQDYREGAHAPRTFGIIDTSNLIDHVGILNLLTAATPLLDHDLSATLYTEMLVRRSKAFKESLENLLSGNFPSMAVLLGLFPVGYWTNASAVFDAGEQLLSDTGADGQMFLRQGWKRQKPNHGIEEFRFSSSSLGALLISCYRSLFYCENLAYLMSHMSLDSFDSNILTPPLYGR
ncbi:hypothetical protein VTO42DRAFT_7163 [Malbranchea cinnamomea]